MVGAKSGSFHSRRDGQIDQVGSQFVVELRREEVGHAAIVPSQLQVIAREGADYLGQALSAMHAAVAQFSASRRLKVAELSYGSVLVRTAQRAR